MDKKHWIVGADFFTHFFEEKILLFSCKVPTESNENFYTFRARFKFLGR